MKIHGTAKGAALSTKDFGVAFSGAAVNEFLTATGGTITENGDYKVHKFTSSGTFEVTALGSVSANNEVEYLVVAGGAGGGAWCAGGGGAGGYRTDTGHAVTVQSYSITVGNGSAGSTSIEDPAPNGENSVFDTITSAGGGGGGSHSDEAGQDGGSGGGNGDIYTTPAGQGNTPSTTPSQGNDGAIGKNVPGGDALDVGGGGGGASAVGAEGVRGSGGNGGNGGAGSASDILVNGSDVYYSGGGGAGTGQDIPTAGSGGVGGGADGSATYNQDGDDAIPNFGGGGGGGCQSAGEGGAGGSGIVILRYQFQ